MSFQPVTDPKLAALLGQTMISPHPAMGVPSSPMGLLGKIRSGIQQATTDPAFNVGLGLLAAGGPRVGAPVSFGQALQQSVQAEQQRQAQSGQLALQRKLMEAQIRKMSQPQPGQSPIGKVDPAKYTPESLRAFQQTGDFARLAPIAGDDKTNQIINEIGDDVRTDSKDFVQQRQAYGRIIASAANPSAAGDLSLIFNFMKVLDPGSTVREGEFANAQNAGGVSSRVQALYNSVLRGERLSEDQRADFTSRAEMLYQQSQRQQQRVNAKAKTRAKNAGIDESLIDPVLPFLDVERVPFDPAPAQRVLTPPSAGDIDTRRPAVQL